MTMKQTELIKKQEQTVEKSKEIAAAEEQERLQQAAVMSKRDRDVAFALMWHEENGMEITPEFKKSVWDLYSAKNNLPQPWGEVNV